MAGVQLYYVYNLSVKLQGLQRKLGVNYTKWILQQRSTLTVVRLPGASETKVRTSKSCAKLVRSGK